MRCSPQRAARACAGCSRTCCLLLGHLEGVSPTTVHHLRGCSGSRQAQGVPSPTPSSTVRQGAAGTSRHIRTMGPRVCCCRPAHWCMASELHISQAPLHMKGQVAVSGLKCYMRRLGCRQLQPYNRLACSVVRGCAARSLVLTCYWSPVLFEAAQQRSSRCTVHATILALIEPPPPFAGGQRKGAGRGRGSSHR